MSRLFTVVTSVIEIALSAVSFVSSKTDMAYRPMTHDQRKLKNSSSCVPANFNILKIIVGFKLYILE